MQTDRRNFSWFRILTAEIPHSLAHTNRLQELLTVTFTDCRISSWSCIQTDRRNISWSRILTAEIPHSRAYKQTAGTFSWSRMLTAEFLHGHAYKQTAGTSHGHVY